MKIGGTNWVVLCGAAIVVTLGLWLVSTTATPRLALAQVPDSGLQRQQMIEELRASNRKLDEIAGLLREIRDARAAEEKKPAPAAKPARTPSLAAHAEKLLHLLQRIANRAHRLRHIVPNRDIKTLFHRHDELHVVQAVVA
jgi:hypothetical protein